MDEKKINYKIVGLILVLSGVFYIILQNGFDQENKFDIIDIIYIIGLGFCVCFSLLAYRKFGNARIFGKSYLLLGIGFIFYLIGDVIYIYFAEIIQEVPYPLIFADLFYWGFYPFVITHIIINIKFFKSKFSRVDKFILIGGCFVGIFTYILMTSNDDIDSFDFNYGLISIMLASVAWAFSMIGFTIFRAPPLGPIWTLLAIGLFISMGADIWYYSSEITESYNNKHPVNALFFTSYMIIIYALYKHIKAYS